MLRTGRRKHPSLRATLFTKEGKDSKYIKRVTRDNKKSGELAALIMFNKSFMVAICLNEYLLFPTCLTNIVLRLARKLRLNNHERLLPVP